MSGRGPQGLLPLGTPGPPPFALRGRGARRGSCLVGRRGRALRLSLPSSYRCPPPGARVSFRQTVRALSRGSAPQNIHFAKFARRTFAKWVFCAVWLGGGFCPGGVWLCPAWVAGLPVGPVGASMVPCGACALVLSWSSWCRWGGARRGARGPRTSAPLRGAAFDSPKTVKRTPESAQSAAGGAGGPMVGKAA